MSATSGAPGKFVGLTLSRKSWRKVLGIALMGARQVGFRQEWIKGMQFSEACWADVPPGRPSKWVVWVRARVGGSCKATRDS